MINIKTKKTSIVGIAALVMALSFGGTALASHSFEAGVAGDTIPDATHVNLNGITLPPGGVLPVYDSSPNTVSGHFLYRGPCDEVTHEGYSDWVPKVTAIGGHIDESATNTHMEKMPLFYISHASTAGSCVWHAHFPDPVNGGSPLTTDMDLINLSGEDVTFNAGDVVDVNIQRVLGSVGSSYEGDVILPGDLGHGNPVYDLNDASDENDGLGFHGHD
jgi:hypothetical protein